MKGKQAGFCTVQHPVKLLEGPREFLLESFMAHLRAKLLLNFISADFLIKCMREAIQAHLCVELLLNMLAVRLLFKRLLELFPFHSSAELLLNIVFAHLLAQFLQEFVPSHFCGELIVCICEVGFQLRNGSIHVRLPAPEITVLNTEASQ
mmetsp:Transcript_112349/g.328487  ORF Transcript_112349/g.328487 Transcript_112349/m.328487 type:complete len:150 (-) Transcript_112349:119-568(-)